MQVAEDLRAPLPAEEFRTAFFADKLTPYVELTRLALDDAGQLDVRRLTYQQRRPETLGRQRSAQVFGDKLTPYVELTRVVEREAGQLDIKA